MFDDDDEENGLFAHYEYNDTDLEDLCNTLMDTMNNQYSMGELDFSINSLKARNVEDNRVRIDCSYAYEAGEFDQASSISFTIPSYVSHEPLEERMYDTIVEMA
jgi:hypothetical protein